MTSIAWDDNELLDEVLIEREVIYISSDEDEEDEAEETVVIDGFPHPDVLAAQPSAVIRAREVFKDANKDPTQLVISTDGSCNAQTAAACCIIQNDGTFGSRTRTFPVLTKSSMVTEIVAMTGACRWGCQLLKLAQRNGGSLLNTVHIMSDCTGAVILWEDPLGKANNSAKHIQDLVEAARIAKSLGVQVVATWGPACATVSLQLADWISRLLADIDLLPASFNIHLNRLIGIQFDLTKHFMRLPDGRGTYIRAKSQPRLKLGFPFRNIFQGCMVFQPVGIPNALQPQVGEKKRKATVIEAPRQPRGLTLRSGRIINGKVAHAAIQTVIQASVPPLAATFPHCLRCATVGHAASDCSAIGTDLVCIWCGFPGHLQLLCHPAVKRVAPSTDTGVDAGTQRTHNAGALL